MKNLCLALAFMLVGTFAFANNVKEISHITNFDDIENIKSFTLNNSNYIVDVEEYFGRCTVRITETDSQGNTHTTTYSWESSSAQDCFNSAQVVITAHFA